MTMASVGILEEGGGEVQPGDVYDEQIEVVEQCVEETREQNIVGDVKELIFDSLLPTYIPVLPPGFEVQSFYECEDCGDRFTIETSYQFHRERRSLLIRYDCPDCTTTVTAYNRCILLAHLRLHGNPSRTTLDWSRVFVSPLPFDRMLIGPLFNIGQYEETISNMSELNSLNEGMKRCPECEAHLRGDLRDHFLGIGNGIPVDHNNKCSYCHMILNSKCSLKAHERYHRQEPPFVCPDCAKVFNMWASFCVHLFYCCFHLDKCIRYRCPACRAYLPTTVSLEVHILTVHVKNVFKCNACPIACFSLQTLEEHKVKGHGHTSLPTNAYQQCQLCPDRLIPKARLLFHVIEHVRKPSVCVYGYQCSSCKLFYQKKSEFATHKARCSEQSSNSVDTRNGMIMVKLKNNTENIMNQNVINGHAAYVHSTESNTSRKDTQIARTAMKTAACQTRTNGNHVPKVYNKSSNPHTEKLDANWENKKTDESVHTSLECEKSDSNSNSNVNFNNKGNTSLEDGTSGPSTSNTSHLCDTCGQEFPNSISSSIDTLLRCTNCSKEKPTPKTRARRSNVRSEVPLKGTLNKNAVNNANKNNRVQTPAGRGKNSIALNGPCNKKIRLSTPEGTDKDKYKCHICKTLIGTEWEVIQDHFAKEHKNFNLLVLSPRINKIEIGENTSVPSCAANLERKGPNNNCNKPIRIKTEPVDDKETEQESNQEQKSKRTRRKMPPRGVQNTPPSRVNTGQLLSTQSQAKSDCKFACFKCKYQSDDVEAFWSHIITHKTDSRAYQCMECGMCFVVKPSFQKHLFISHRIKDVEKYIQDHEMCHQKPKRETRGQSEDPGSPGADEGEELEENQCRVCRLKFETTVQLNKHFRTHGMAFLMMKQQENRTSSK